MGNTIRQIAMLLSIIGIGLTISGQTVYAAPVDHSIWGELLKKHVKNGVVDYAGFKQDESRLEEYLDRLERIDPASLESSERMAFYINVYNAWTVKLILTEYPGIKSIKDLGSLITSPWKKKS